MPPASAAIVVVGDSPFGPSGLGRICRDLVTRLRADESLGVTVGCVGWEADGPWVGRPDWYVAHQDTEGWGRTALERYATTIDRRVPLIVFSIWDPARVYGLRQADISASWWGYFPIDGHNVQGAIGGPAAQAVQGYDRILAYTRFGARVLNRTTGRVIPDLPHGIDLDTFRPRIDDAAWATLGEILAPTVRPDSILIGCVATNQPRKDLGLLFSTVARMHDRDPRVRLWLHVDRPIGRAWAVPQLAADFGLSRALVVTTELDDADLASLYSWCAVTIAPGLGEGFGYPIVESLACGTPVVHGTYGGGSELVPSPAWTFPERLSRLESPYAIQRPVYDPTDVANAAWRAIGWRRAEPAVVRAWCRASVEHLSWERLWPVWRRWVRAGLAEA